MSGLSHRSKKRIKELGEVFTPSAYVDDMLDLLSKDQPDIWGDAEVSFFEPCCGNGNFVIAIYARRLGALYNKALSELSSFDAAYSAVANAIDTLWAIDIDGLNVAETRARVMTTTMEFLTDKLNGAQIEEGKLFFIKCAIDWHIHENECLSALTIDTVEAQKEAKKTKAGAKWFEENGHHPIDFELTWATMAA
mgnify:CR=1 FL=1